MRGLSECKAEVFRRSENRIKEGRKKRNRVIALCIPLVLFITAYSVMILPAMMPAGEANHNGHGEMYGESANGSDVCSYTEVVIRNADSPDGESQRVTDKAAVTEMFEAIFSLDGEIGAGAIAANESEQQIENAGRLTGCIITFITDDGLKTVYTLNKNELLNVSANTKIILTDAQVTELKATLGISD